MSLFVNIYARLIYSIFAFLITHVYHRQQPKTMPFSAEKHTKMARLSLYAFELFNLLTMVVGKKTKEAREIVAGWLKENGLLEKEEIITLNISKAQRSGGTARAPEAR